jgi:hypothetical protein
MKCVISSEIFEGWREGKHMKLSREFAEKFSEIFRDETKFDFYQKDHSR